MKERSREMGSSPPTAEEIFRDYSAPRTDALRPSRFTIITPSLPSRPHHRRRKHYHTIILQQIRERKYNHTCVVALQIGALLTNGSRQRIICKTNPKPFFPSSRSCQRLGIKLLCPSPSDVAPLAVLSLLGCSEGIEEEFWRRKSHLGWLLALAQNENKAAIIELNCETDFVARYLSILGISLWKN
ncbi:hypothetical protein ACFX1Z_033635 [Malus domestica]